MSNARRWPAAVAVAVVAAAVGLVATAQPAAANTNFNGVCQLSEACAYDDYFGQGWTWDYEGTDTNFSNNWSDVPHFSGLIWPPTGRGGQVAV